MPFDELQENYELGLLAGMAKVKRDILELLANELDTCECESPLQHLETSIKEYHADTRNRIYQP